MLPSCSQAHSVARASGHSSLICLLRVLAASVLWYDPSAGRHSAGKLVSGRPISEFTSGGKGGGSDDGEDVWMGMDAQVWQVVRLTWDGLNLSLMPGDRVCGAVAQTGHSPTYARLDITGTCAVICVVCVLRLRALCRGGR